jgi:hypothetical protein
LTAKLLTTILPQGFLHMSQTTKTYSRYLAPVFALLGALAVPTLACAQNCALCYTQAAGAGQRLIHALRSGILMLVAPPMLICIAIAVMAYKKRNHFHGE